MRNRPALTAADVHKMMAACRDEAAKNKWNVTIAVVDDAGFLPTPRASGRRRAHDRRGRRRLPENLPIQGGVSIMYQGDCVGAIGVSGVQSHQDEQIANAGVAALS